MGKISSEDRAGQLKAPVRLTASSLFSLDKTSCCRGVGVMCGLGQEEPQRSRAVSAQNRYLFLDPSQSLNIKVAKHNRSLNCRY